MRLQVRKRIHMHTLTYNIRASPGALGVKRISGHQSGLLCLFSFPIFSSDLLSLDGSQVLSCLSALPVTFSKLYIQNEILSLQECTIWERSHNLEGTFQRCEDFQMPIETHGAWFLFFFSPPSHSSASLFFFIVIPHFSSHSTSNIGPRFQFVVWPFLSYILGESANSIVLLGF